jgi:hypothetical protein
MGGLEPPTHADSHRQANAVAVIHNGDSPPLNQATRQKRRSPAVSRGAPDNSQSFGSA